MAAPEQTSAEAEHRHHRYLGYEIPWYVHTLWILFWILCIWYILRYQFPIIQSEIVNPP